MGNAHCEQLLFMPLPLSLSLSLYPPSVTHSHSLLTFGKRLEVGFHQSVTVHQICRQHTIPVLLDPCQRRPRRILAHLYTQSVVFSCFPPYSPRLSTSNETLVECDFSPRISTRLSQSDRLPPTKCRH